MLKRIFLLGLFLSFTLSACNSQTPTADLYRQAEPVQVKRFDRQLLRWLEAGEDADKVILEKEYRAMLELTGKGILNVPSPDREDFFDKLSAYYAEPTLRGLYRDAVARYDSVASLEQTLGMAFAFLEETFPGHAVPALYMHVSGFNQNVLVGDSALSVSIDKYLGEDYPLYREYFSPYERRKMKPDFVAADYVTGWLMSEFPFSGKENVLLDQMVYYGKIYYLLSLALPDTPVSRLMGYTDEEETWCRENERGIWKEIVGRKHLFTPDLATTQKYFEPRPCSFLSDHAPAAIGIWVGVQLVRSYMAESGATPALLMTVPAQDLLAASKYKP